MLSKDYPWTGKPSSCSDDYNKMATKVAKVNQVKSRSAQNLKAAIAEGPVAITIDASKYAFLHYMSGVITDKDCGTAMTHSVSAVGYGNENGTEYYLLKNSWGKDWGEHGYVRV